MQKKHFSLSANPARVITGSFLGVIITGTLLLMLPLSAKNGAVTNFFDALFTATSATCVTGLIVVDTYTHWTFFGQGVILSLIQIGGLGLVTLTLFFNLLIRRKLGLRTLQLAQESTSASNFEDTPICNEQGRVIKDHLIVHRDNGRAFQDIGQAASSVLIHRFKMINRLK